jgi:DNA repair exonuclease SbcCD ATPase subunit
VTHYFLTRVKVEGFRGINNEKQPLELRFKPEAVNSVFAVNSTGKSSIFEALCYAIRGKRQPKNAVSSGRIRSTAASSACTWAGLG